MFLGVVGCVISGVVLGTIYCLMPLFLKHQGMNHSSVGYWMALLIAAAILGQWPMGRLADKYGRAFVMKCQSLLVVAACAGLVLKGGLMDAAVFRQLDADGHCAGGALLHARADAGRRPRKKKAVPVKEEGEKEASGFFLVRRGVFLRFGHVIVRHLVNHVRQGVHIVLRMGIRNGVLAQA